MADKKVSEFNALTTVEDTDIFMVDRAGVSYNITGANLLLALDVSHYEVLMADGLDTPPEPLTDELGVDWLYGKVQI